CFRYVMDAPIRYFFTVVSAKYAVKRDVWKSRDGRKVSLEVYHHPTHTWNVDRMIQGMKDTLAYCEESFTPFQYRQMRILEFPAYATFAQSFPNTVPFSEGIGFVLKNDPDPRAISTAYYVTAHEVAHQWWAHQVVGADAAGSEMLSESLADYTAQRIATRSLPPAGVRRAAQQNLDRYLRGRGADRLGENPLARVQHQDYIHYSKGSLVLGALAGRVGEKALNGAIAAFARTHAFGAAPYPTGEDFVAHLETTFPAQKAWIGSQFRRIALVDFRIVDAKKTRQADGRWKVEATVALESRESNSGGNETAAAFSDTVSVWLADRGDRRGFTGKVLSEANASMVPGENKLV
ncbi:MAG: M1 family aminopeptidase, partial [Armatimonadaceae bacterium]